MNLRRVGILFSAVAGGMLATSCAIKPVVSETLEARSSHESEVVQVADDSRPYSKDASSESEQILTNLKFDSGNIERSDLKQFEKIAINLLLADIIIKSGPAVSGVRAPKFGTLRIQRVHGDTNCKVLVEETEGEMKISDPSRKLVQHALLGDITTTSAVTKTGKSNMPGAAHCRFALELTMPKAAALGIDLVRGTVFIENWDKPIQVKMDWGDVDVGMIGDLNVDCGRCTLAGENIAGALRYKLETGNVGLAGLMGSVDGQTLGDTVLKWRKVAPKSEVKLISRAGDVILFFPAGVPVAMDVKVPRGDFDSKLSEHSGVPVSVVAELGNVRLYRTTLTRTSPH